MFLVRAGSFDPALGDGREQMSDKPVLQVKNLTVRLPRGADRENAVENINLEVRPQEILCVVGESGSGKSVAVASILGLLPPAS